MKNFALVLHGGAGTIIKEKMTSKKERAYKQTLQKALDAGYSILEKNGTATVAAETAVNVLEDSPLFNAGKGSVFNAVGTHEMEASIMEGKHRNAGAVALLKGIKNPISLARDVMEHSTHVSLAGEGALAFAKSRGYSFEQADYFYDEFRYQQWQKIKNSDNFQLDHSDKKNSKIGTVGAVACDQLGNLAAATSTGGMTNKKVGRLGDSGINGIGNYANNKTCAVSCTGSGEYFIRAVAAFDVSCLMEYKKLSLEKAAAEVIYNHILKIGGDGGLIAVDAQGNMTMPFNTEGMYRACKSSTGKRFVGIYKNS